MPSSRLEDFEVLEVIGSGSYGRCTKVRRKEDSRILVWKELLYGDMSEAEKQMLVTEVNLLRDLKHKHIVRYYDRIIDRTSTTIYIVMEYCEGGDLGKLIAKHKRERKYIEEAFVWKAMYQLALALQECHIRRDGGHILHRDLKPANVFLDREGNVKLGDFGLARVLSCDTSFAKTFVGTPYYMSPEQVSKHSYNEKSDIWSLGCLVYELCCLHPPFLAANQQLLALKIKEGKYKSLPPHYSSSLESLVGQMLQTEDWKRPSIGAILVNPTLHAVTNGITKKERKNSVSQLGSLLKKKEEFLKIKEKELMEREKEVERREWLVGEKERILTEKMARVEVLMQRRHSRDYKQSEMDIDKGKENVYSRQRLLSKYNMDEVDERKVLQPSRAINLGNIADLDNQFDRPRDEYKMAEQVMRPRGGNCGLGYR